jgi:hypothetical protein
LLKSAAFRLHFCHVANGGGGAVKLAVLRGRVAPARVAHFSHAATCGPAMKNGWLDGAGGESSPACLSGLLRVRDCHRMAETPALRLGEALAE